MKSVRLNYSLRQKIVRNTVDDVLQIRYKELSVIEQELAPLIYRSVISEDAEASLRRPGFTLADSIMCLLHTSDDIQDYAELHFPENDLRPRGAFGETSWYRVRNLTPEIQAKVDAYIAYKRQLRKDEQFLSNRILNTVNAVTTTKRLVTIWPTAAKYIPEESVRETTSDDTLSRVDALNQAILALGGEIDSES
jgi:hypothetical protein